MENFEITLQLAKDYGLVDPGVTVENNYYADNDHFVLRFSDNTKFYGTLEQTHYFLMGLVAGHEIPRGDYYPERYDTMDS